MTQTSDFKDFRNYTPLTDPFNQQPKGPHGLYPARLHTEGGRLAYYPSAGYRRTAVLADEYGLKFEQRLNAPWYKKLWWGIKPEL